MVKNKDMQFFMEDLKMKRKKGQNKLYRQCPKAKFSSENPSKRLSEDNESLTC